MTGWHTVRARFTSEEMRILDILHQVYGLNYNQSLKTGIEMFGRMLAGAELYAQSDSRIVKRINNIAKKYNRLMNAEIKQALKEFPEDQQQEEYEKLSADKDRIFLQFDKVFVKNRKKGRKKIPRKRGKPSTRL